MGEVKWAPLSERYAYADQKANYALEVLERALARGDGGRAAAYNIMTNLLAEAFLAGRTSEGER